MKIDINKIKAGDQVQDREGNWHSVDNDGKVIMEINSNAAIRCELKIPLDAFDIHGHREKIK